MGLDGLLADFGKRQHCIRGDGEFQVPFTDFALGLDFDGILRKGEIKPAFSIGGGPGNCLDSIL